MSLAYRLPRPLCPLADVRAWALPVMSAVLCLGGVAALVPPALAATAGGSSSVDSSSARPSVRLEGTLGTAGLPAAATTSALTVINDGPLPVTWTVRGHLDGDAAPAVSIDVLEPGEHGCGSPGASLGGWSASALEPGASVVVCVTIRSRAPAAGVVTPTVTVDARAA